jgi:hypothetical protein
MPRQTHQWPNGNNDGDPKHGKPAESQDSRVDNMLCINVALINLIIFNYLERPQRRQKSFTKMLDSLESER